MKDIKITFLLFILFLVAASGHFNPAGAQEPNIRQPVDTKGKTVRAGGLTVAHEWEIIHSISGELTPENIRKFMGHTVQDDDHRVYKWTWCGRYSVPMGLMTSYYLAQSEEDRALYGIPVGYRNSIDHEHLKVDDLAQRTLLQVIKCTFYIAQVIFLGCPVILFK